MKVKKWDKFVEQCNSTILPTCKSREYLSAGLASEIGEVLGKYKKFVRGDFPEEKLSEIIKTEIGDCLWYVAMLEKYCSDQTITFSVSSISYETIVTHLTKYEAVIRLNSETARVLDSIAFEPLSAVDIFGFLMDLNKTASVFNLSLAECADAVIDKLSARKEIGTIKGSGDGVVR